MTTDCQSGFVAPVTQMRELSVTGFWPVARNSTVRPVDLAAETVVGVVARPTTLPEASSMRPITRVTAPVGEMVTAER
ncbi:hypothetical protein ASF06_01830 [Agreia sp. Leaf244]|nr:hypothetical protein ASF06_01830 [Agreia sp. Leaf244]